MKVAYLTSQYPAPSHTFIFHEVTALRTAGVDIHTFSVRRPEPSDILSDVDQRQVDTTTYLRPFKVLHLLANVLWACTLKPIGLASATLLSLRHRPPGIRSFVYAFFYLGEALLLARALSDRKIDRLHNHFANSGAIVGLLATKILQIPWSVTLHGISEFDYPAGILLPEKIAHADFVACSSYFNLAQASRTTDSKNWTKLVLVRCGVDVESIPLKTSFQERSRQRVICVARLSPEKGHIGLLQAFVRLKANGLDAELRLVGDGPCKDQIEAEIQRLQLSDCCVLLGSKPNKEALREIAASDILVIASFMEGLPVVLMEALAAQVPVIAPCVAGIPELIGDDCGLLFTPGNWTELADSITTLLRDANLQARLGANGRSRIEDEFRIEKAIEPLVARFSA